MQDLIALTDDDTPPSGDINPTILNQVIQNASGVVDMYCANLYGQQLPFNPVPSSVTNLALVIACYMLYERRETPDELNKFTARYKAAISMLEKVNTGDMHLNDVPYRDFSQVQFTGRASLYGPQFSNLPSNSM